MKQSVHARVTVVLEVFTGSWGPECSMDQITRQAKESAVGTIRRLSEKDRDIRIIDTPRVVAVLATEDQTA